MPFPKDVRDEALVRSHRRCCVCHEFGGRSVNVHHIVQEADDGPNTLANAICLCLRCHAEAGHFNLRHPMGTKYSPKELVAHRDQWWEHCKKNPEEPLGLFVEVGFKAISRTQELHRYHLLVSYTNTFKEAHEGWKIQIYFPAFIPVKTGDFDKFDERIGGIQYTELESASGSRVFPGERIQVVPSMKYFFIEYQVNEDVYRLAKREDRVFWRFFTSNAPAIEGEKLFSELHEF